jgi:hypothetical protein
MTTEKPCITITNINMSTIHLTRHLSSTCPNILTTAPQKQKPLPNCQENRSFTAETLWKYLNNRFFPELTSMIVKISLNTSKSFFNAPSYNFLRLKYAMRHLIINEDNTPYDTDPLREKPNTFGTDPLREKPITFRINEEVTISELHRRLLVISPYESEIPYCMMILLSTEDRERIYDLIFLKEIAEKSADLNLGMGTGSPRVEQAEAAWDAGVLYPVLCECKTMSKESVGTQTEWVEEQTIETENEWEVVETTKGTPLVNQSDWEVVENTQDCNQIDWDRVSQAMTESLATYVGEAVLSGAEPVEVKTQIKQPSKANNLAVGKGEKCVEIPGLMNEDGHIITNIYSALQLRQAVGNLGWSREHQNAFTKGLGFMNDSRDKRKRIMYILANPDLPGVTIS